MGQPDEIKQTMDEAFNASMMPGPIVGGTGGAAALGYAANSTGAGLGDVSTTMMPSGSTDPKSAQNQPQVLYFIYKWRGNHDYLWFKVDSVKEQVIQSSWYHAYE